MSVDETPKDEVVADVETEAAEGAHEAEAKVEDIADDLAKDAVEPDEEQPADNAPAAAEE